MRSRRELSTRAPSGDRWQLARDTETGQVLVRHEDRLASGGRVTEIEIGCSHQAQAGGARASGYFAVSRAHGRGAGPA